MIKVFTFFKKIIKAIIWVIIGFVIFFFIIAVLIQLPAIQTKIIRYATTFVSDKTHTKVDINDIYISFPQSVHIQGLFLEDIKQDTLLYAGNLKVNISLNDLFSKKINIKSVSLEDVKLNLNRTEKDSLFNYNFLITSFSDTSTQKKSESKTKSDWKFNIDNVNLKNIQFNFNDKYGGTKASAKLNNLSLKMNELNLEKSVFRIDNLLIDGLISDILINKKSKTEEADSGKSILPEIHANKTQFNNIHLSYIDSVGNQFLTANINQFLLRNASVDLQKQIISSDEINLSKSSFRFYTMETKQSIDDSITNTSEKNKWKIAVKSINLDDNSFLYKVVNIAEIRTAFDINHLDYKHIKFVAKDLFYSSEKTEIKISAFTAVDQNNFAVTEFETDFSMDSHSVSAQKLKLKTSRSSIDADLRIQYTSLNSLQKDLPFMKVNAEMRNVTLNNFDILYFYPDLKKQTFFRNTMNITKISGKVSGSVNNLKGEKILVKTGINTLLSADFRIKALPDIKKAFFDFPNLKINSGRSDIAFIAGSSIPKSIELPQKLSLEIAFKGQIKEFQSVIKMKTSFGDANLNAVLGENENFKSSISITDFNLGALLKNTTMYGPVSMIAGIEGQGLTKNTIKAKIEAVSSHFYFNKYTYQNLSINGNVNRQMFDGKVSLKDKNAEFDFEGLVNLNPAEENYKFQLNLKGADLCKLNFTKDDIRIGLQAETDLKGAKLNEINGKSLISNIVLTHNNKKYFLDSIGLNLFNYQDKSMLSIKSDIADITYKGELSPVFLPEMINKIINKYFHFSDYDSLTAVNKDFVFDAELRNHPLISEVFFPQLKEFEPVLIHCSFDSKNSILKFNASENKIIYGSTEINKFAINIISDTSILNYYISSSSVSNSQFKFNNLMLAGKFAENAIFADLSSIDDNKDKKLSVSTKVIKNNENYKLSINPENFYLMYKRWNIAADNYLEFGKQGFLIHHLFLNSAESQINIASANDKFNDDLNIAIKNFRLEDISGIIEKDSNLLKGRLDGNLLLKRINNTYGLIADASIKNLFFREVAIGNLTLKAENPTAERFDINLNLYSVDNNLTVKGYFYPKGGDNSININADIKSLSLKTLEAFSQGSITKASGLVSGNFLIDGNFTNPDITGKLVFDNAFVTPTVLNNQIHLKHETVLLKKDGIYFNSFTVMDDKQQKAVIEGHIQMKEFKDFVFDLHINANDFLLFNTTAEDNKAYYGRMIIDSKIDVNGPMSLPIVFAKIKMKKGSDFTFAVPEKRITADKGEDVVEFDNSLKSNSILNKKDEKTVQKSGLTGFDISSVIEIDKQATLRLLMDPSSSDSLVVAGEAALSFSIDRSGKMSLTGAYNVNEGGYTVSLESIIKKKFKINQGSTIVWNGDPLDAEISINATYTVRTSPYELVADQLIGLSESEKGGYKQPYPFMVILKLRGQIMHPEINFEIQLAPENKGILGGTVNSKLILLNEDESALNKQVFALLVLNRFIQENPLESGIGNTMSTVRTTVGKLLSAQLNQLSSKIVPGVELNFDIQSYEDYQSGQAEGRTQIDIGVKKQLFNDRFTVQIGGKLDVEGEKAKQTSTSDIMSDVSMEYKLTKDGRYRLKAFRHNQYEGAIEGQLVETGIGVLYVRDFENWKDLFKSPENKNESLNKANGNEKH